jgi:hypothetical protein
MPPPPTLPPSSPDDPAEPSSMGREMDDEDLVEELLLTVNAARAFAEFRRTQRKECANLLRWLQLVLPLLEELRDAAPRLTDDAYRRLALLGRALAAARRLLRTCHDGSKIYLVGSIRCACQCHACSLMPWRPGRPMHVVMLILFLLFLFGLV